MGSKVLPWHLLEVHCRVPPVCQVQTPYWPPYVLKCILNKQLLKSDAEMLPKNNFHRPSHKSGLFPAQVGRRRFTRTVTQFSRSKALFGIYVLGPAGWPMNVVFTVLVYFHHDNFQNLFHVIL